MDLSFRIPGTEGPDIVVRRPFIGGMSVVVDGVKAQRTSRRRLQYRIPLRDGTSTELVLAGQWRGLNASIAGQDFPIERQLGGWELALIVLPFALVLIGGLLGGLLAGIAAVVNVRLLRRIGSVPGRIAATLGVSAAAAALFVGAAVAVVPVPQLAVGSCLNGVAEGATVTANSSRPVSCDEPHDNEVVGSTTDASNGSFPGQQPLLAEGEGPCIEAFKSYVGIDYEASELGMIVVVPSDLTWAKGDRAISCVVLSQGGGKLTGSVSGTAR